MGAAYYSYSHILPIIYFIIIIIIIFPSREWLVYLKGKLLDADALSEPGERGVEKLKQSDECDQVGGDVGNQRHRVRRTCRRRRLDDIHRRSVEQRNTVVQRQWQ